MSPRIYLPLVAALATALLAPSGAAERRTRRLSARDLRGLARPAIDAALEAGCHAEAVHVRRGTTVGSGELAVRALVRTPRRSGEVTASLVLTAGGRETRVNVRATVACPPPVIRPGDGVRIVVRTATVLATAPGVAAQAGRVGERIRVTNSATHTTLVVRVVDAYTVEVDR